MSDRSAFGVTRAAEGCGPTGSDECTDLPATAHRIRPLVPQPGRTAAPGGPGYWRLPHGRADERAPALTVHDPTARTLRFARSAPTYNGLHINAIIQAQSSMIY